MKRYVVKYTIYSCGVEDGYYEVEFDTMEEATLYAMCDSGEDGDGDSITAEIFDRGTNDNPKEDE